MYFLGSNLPPIPPVKLRSKSNQQNQKHKKILSCITIDPSKPLVAQQTLQVSFPRKKLNSSTSSNDISSISKLPQSSQKSLSESSQNLRTQNNQTSSNYILQKLNDTIPIVSTPARKQKANKSENQNLNIETTLNQDDQEVSISLLDQNREIPFIIEKYFQHFPFNNLHQQQIPSSSKDLNQPSSSQYEPNFPLTTIRRGKSKTEEALTKYLPSKDEISKSDHHKKKTENNPLRNETHTSSQRAVPLSSKPYSPGPADKPINNNKNNKQQEAWGSNILSENSQKSRLFVEPVIKKSPTKEDQQWSIPNTFSKYRGQTEFLKIPKTEASNNAQTTINDPISTQSQIRDETHKKFSLLERPVSLLSSANTSSIAVLPESPTTHSPVPVYEPINNNKNYKQQEAWSSNISSENSQKNQLVVEPVSSPTRGDQQWSLPKPFSTIPQQLNLDQTEFLNISKTETWGNVDSAAKDVPIWTQSQIRNETQSPSLQSTVSPPPSSMVVSSRPPIPLKEATRYKPINIIEDMQQPSALISIDENFNDKGLSYSKTVMQTNKINTFDNNQEKSESI